MAMKIKNRLPQLLKDSGTTQSELARAIGVRKNTIGDYVAQRVTRPDLDIVAKICRYFMISVDGFFYSDDS